MIYVGTFSKVMFPALRLGYLVVPPDLVDAFAAARAVSDRHSPLSSRPRWPTSSTRGTRRHIRRMRMLYAERQAALVDAASRELGEALDLRPADAGMHLNGLPAAGDRRPAPSRAARPRSGVEASPLSAYALGPLTRGGLVLGYAGARPADIRSAVPQAREAPFKP